MQVFDSNGPDVRIRGTAHQVCEKYMALAKDAHGAGDLILAESYLQHAEHYQRVINSWQQEDDRMVAARQETQKSEEAAIDGNVISDDEDGDLGLPASIVGKSQVAAPAEAVLEDA